MTCYSVQFSKMFLSILILINVYCKTTFVPTKKSIKATIVSKYPVVSLETMAFEHSLLGVLTRFNESNQKCSKTCIYHDHKKISNETADVYVYHLPNVLPGMETVVSERAHRSYQFLISEESPVNYVLPMEPSYFHVMLGYVSSAGTHYPYDRFEKIDNETKETEIWSDDQVFETVSKKNKSLLWIVSHCQTASGREHFVEELSKHITVTKYGKCNSLECDKDCEAKELENHHFYLAFENTVCRDYVTEKFWKLKKLIIPIVLTRKVVNANIPENSFIAVDDFADIKSLVAHLNFLMDNKTEYLKYFDWTKTYKKSNYLNNQGLCFICDVAHSLKNGLQSLENSLDYTEWVRYGKCDQEFVRNRLKLERSSVSSISSVQSVLNYLFLK